MQNNNSITIWNTRESKLYSSTNHWAGNGYITGHFYETIFTTMSGEFNLDLNVKEKYMICI